MAIKMTMYVVKATITCL